MTRSRPRQLCKQEPSLLRPFRGLLAGSVLVMVAIGLVPAPAYADVVFDNFDDGGGFDSAASYNAAYVKDDNAGTYAALRCAAQFTVSGGSFTLDSIKLPVSMRRDVAEDILRVRLAADDGGKPGTTLEVLSENQDIWPTLTIPFTTTTTLTSTLHPLLEAGGSYWIVTEPSTVPVGPAPYDVSFRWFDNTSGSTVPACQQWTATQDQLPTDPWPAPGATNVAFSVEGTPAAAPIPSLSGFGIGVCLVLLAGAAVVAIRRMAS